MKISCIVPCWQRPQRTMRVVECVRSQSHDDWELLLVGDCCPQFEKSVEPEVAALKDPRIITRNLSEHEGQFGTQCLNWGLDHATGDAICFMGNDDMILPDHFAVRVHSLECSPWDDVVYHNALVKLRGGFAIRGGALAHGATGGSELVIRKPFLDDHPVRFRSGDYGHDWLFIEDLLQAGARFRHWDSATYVVCHIPGIAEEGGID